MNFNYLYVLLIALISLPATAQIKVTGQVLNFSNEPQTDVMIYADSILIDSKTNSRGFFKIKVPETTKQLHVFSPKYGLMSTDNFGEELVKFVFLDPKKNKDNSDFSKVVKEDLLSSNPVYDHENINVDPNIQNFNSIFDYIEGRVAGVVITADNHIKIRGTNSFVDPGYALLVVNGMVVAGIDNISVNEIKDVKILKNGASVYGSRGANGVVQITLKD
ncbi:TonB-dependent receptor plug domain-containing protein [Gramella sp. AN32]|uniref:TonB-dependent receptor plug domain-containing protein n=1 Tax=Christiangramia antarctica TaxID=2058158 RepID=A0ABW5X9P2_9FLAO|nr:TonB-dependent receptor plug domain-containing protein [Gramella sp. AN32]MCM4155512.1 hypothetical protein [Gramella sp. AN32]